VDNITERSSGRISGMPEVVEFRSSLPMTSLLHFVSPAIWPKNLSPDVDGGQTASRTTQGNAMQSGDNRTLGMRVHEALVEAAQAKNEAFKLERKYKRTLKAHIIIAEGKSFGERETIASTRKTVEEAEDAWVAAELIANTAKAEADGLEIQFKEWQSRNATNRAEMNLR
jgi:hypothetical protein